MVIWHLKFVGVFLALKCPEQVASLPGSLLLLQDTENLCMQLHAEI